MEGNINQRAERFHAWRRWCVKRHPPRDFYRLLGTVEQQVRYPGWIQMAYRQEIDDLLSDLILTVEAKLSGSGWQRRRPLVGSPYWVKGAAEYHCNGSTVWDAPEWPNLDDMDKGA